MSSHPRSSSVVVRLYRAAPAIVVLALSATIPGAAPFIAAHPAASAIAAHPAASVSAARPAAPDDVCEVFTDKTARPSDVYVGQEVEIVLTVTGRCPDVTGTGGRADIVLAIDRSSSQRDNGTWEPTVQAAGLFLDLVDFTQNQVALVPFEFDASISQPLTSDAAAVRAALARIPEPPALGLWTSITAAVNAAQAELAGPRHRADATPILVLLSDGQHNALVGGAPIPAADAAKRAGTTIITIGLGVNEGATTVLRTMASTPELYFPAPTAADLADAYRKVAGALSQPGELSALEVYDLIAPEVTYIAGSADPAPAVTRPGELIWRIPRLTEGGWTARYRVRADVAGNFATNKLAYVDYIDADGKAATRDFPEPRITVREAPERIEVFLPILYHRFCKPAQPFDVVLAVDTSSSMWGEKLTRTREAARNFIRFLEMPPSQAGVVAFNSEATVVQALTADRAAALAALDNLPTGEGTRIDKALLSAVDALTRPDRDPGHAPVIVLLTDGRQDGAADQEARNAAAAARRAGITVFTIGFGADVDPTLLQRIAGDPDRYYSAPTLRDLERIYSTIAGVLPCGVGP